MRRTLWIAALGSLAAATPGLAADWPAWFLHVPDSARTLLVADTGNATLYEYTVDGRDKISVVDYYMSIGVNGAGKQRAGDRRTPLGVYFITEQLDTSRLHEKYGITAFPLDYPNTIDRLAGRTGDGIWLHGVTPGPDRRPERDTDGCIALPNEDLEALSERIRLLETPVIVTREMAFLAPDERARTADALEQSVSAWKQAVGASDLLAYLSLYDESFSYRGLPRERWAEFRTRQFLERQPDEVAVRDLFILRDPEDATLYVTRFVLDLTSAGGTATSLKRLYWRQGDDGRYRIVAEDNG